MIPRRAIRWETETQYDKNGRVKGWLYRGVYKDRVGPWLPKPGDARRALHRELTLEYLAEKVGRLYGLWCRRHEELGGLSPNVLQLEGAMNAARAELEKVERRK